MYSQQVILETLDEFKRRNGWMPQYHSIDEVDRFKKHIDSLVEIEGNSRSTTITPKRDFTPAEIQFIRNERALCWADAHYFLSRYCYICDEANNIFRFLPRKSQEIFLKLLEQFEEGKVAIEILLLKARQLGMSTIVELLFLHRLLFIKRTQAITASVNQDTSELLQRMAYTCLDELPWWLPPQRRRNREGKLLEFVTGSIWSIQSGTQKMGIGQGWTPTLIHISECGDYPNPKKTLEEGLMRATHPSASLFAVYEGTGNGNVGWWPESWYAAKKLWPLGKSRLCPLFLSWPMATDLYPLPDWLKKFPVPYEWNPRKETRLHVAKCENYIRNTPIINDIMGKNWRMPVEQQWYWEFNYVEALEKHTQKIWLQQMPADDTEALQGKNDTVFGLETIEVVTKKKKPYETYAITGAGIDEEFNPSTNEVDYEKPRIEITWDSVSGDTFQWTLIPMRPFEDYDERNSMGKLLVFHEPNELDGKRIGPRDYSIGVDTADGLGEDRGIVNVTMNRTGENSDVQVAEFASDRVNSPQMVGFAAALGAWYGIETLDQRGAKFCIEQRRKPGDDCQLQLKRMGFFYHHRFVYYDGKKIDETKASKEGWFTNSWSRPLLLGRFVDGVVNGWLNVNSPFLIQEMKSFERKMTEGGVSRLEHQKGKHDDRIFAQAMAYFTRHALDVMLARANKRLNMPKDKLPMLTKNWATGFKIAVGDLL